MENKNFTVHLTEQMNYWLDGEVKTVLKVANECYLHLEVVEGVSYVIFPIVGENGMDHGIMMRIKETPDEVRAMQEEMKKNKE